MNAPHTVRPDCYYLLLYFIDYTGGNVLGYVWRHKSEGPWHVDYRYRYFVDDKVFDSEDRKIFHRASGPRDTPEADLREFIRTLVEGSARSFDDLGDFKRSRIVDVGGNCEKFLDALSSCDFVHFQVDEREVDND